ncbi:hypothetical protein SPWS13_3232 [Shewanella putrefaciens]|nr:hypothetical protein SPWS13_3232 [Shewanella putrefaciens]
MFERSPEWHHRYSDECYVKLQRVTDYILFAAYYDLIPSYFY